MNSGSVIRKNHHSYIVLTAGKYEIAQLANINHFGKNEDCHVLILKEEI